MSNKNTDPVFQLVKSLTKSEKRHFRLFTKRQGSNDDLKFLQLFDAIDQLEDYDEEVVLQKAHSIKKAQLANLKANLYKQLLCSLRIYHTNQNVDIQLHEQIDYARVLYNKGLYTQSLKMLEKVKIAAVQAELPHTALLAIDFEKQIESQYITRSIEGKAELISSESTELALHVTQVHELSNASLRLYGLYIKVGHARNQEDYEMITAFFKESLPNVDLQNAGFLEKLYYYQTHVWYYYLVHDFKSCYRKAQKWVDLFETNPDMRYKQQVLYIKGLHNLLASLFNLLYYRRFIEVLNQLEAFSQDPERKSNPNTEMLLYYYIYTSKINSYFMEGRFTEGLEIIPSILEFLENYKLQLDPHQMLVFYFKIASLYFGSGDNYKAIEYLNKIIQYKEKSLREDLQSFARILNLIAHYEAGEDLVLEYQVKSVYHFLGRMKEQHQMQEEIFKFLRNLGEIAPHQLKDEFLKLKDKLVKIAEQPFERRSFLYLDIISWLESKIEDIPVQEVMKRKFLTMKIK
jgi:hypothetical protein